jgi:hypothetical protein
VFANLVASSNVLDHTPYPRGGEHD